MDNGIRPVADAAERDTLWRKAKGIHVRSAAAAVVFALLGVVL